MWVRKYGSSGLLAPLHDMSLPRLPALRFILLSFVPLDFAAPPPSRKFFLNIKFILTNRSDTWTRYLLLLLLNFLIQLAVCVLATNIRFKLNLTSENLLSFS